MQFYFQGFASFITALDWSIDGNLIRTNNNDFEQHICEFTFVMLTAAAKYF